MWERFKRIIRSIFGAAIDAAEDPEMILKQNMRDLKDQVPKMNESIAMIRANQTLLENEIGKLNQQEKELSAKIQAALKAGRRDIALTYANQFEQVKKDKANSEAQLEAAKGAYEKAMQVKRAFIQDKERKKQAAMNALAANKRAQWQAKVADAMEKFQVGGIDATHDEMVRKLEEKAAVSQAKLDMALDKVDAEGYKIEQEAQAIESNETLRQFELQMGLVKPDELTAPAEKSLGAKTAEAKKE
ncbi:MAG TPA: PspA/IM30 family protein, partial [Planctomycetota bacterium]|nr:PspA/IM30 family protein [Planctomycetota bacterium]